MTFPTRYTVAVQPHLSGVDDAHGNPSDTWGAGVDQLVYGWAPAGSSEPFEAGRNPVTSDLDLFAPEGFSCTAHDRVVVGGLVYEVEGDLLDFNHGPFGWRPGTQVRLRRVTG